MLFRSVRWFCRPAVDMTRLQPQEIKWFRMNGSYWLQIKNPDSTIIPLTNSMTFQKLLDVNSAFSPRVSLPSGTALQTQVSDFLLKSKSPQQVDVTLNGKSYYIRNSASFAFNQVFERVVSKPDNLHQQIERRIKEEGLSWKQASVLTYYELLFQKEVAKLPSDKIFTQQDRREIMLKIMGCNQLGSSQKMWDLKIEELNLDRIINALDIKIEQFEAKRQRKYMRYKLAIAALSCVHIFGFGYAIFFVDYLGWDIMEPLTYTIGLFGTILAISFFIRHRMDRSNESIKQMFKRIITRSQDRVWMQDILHKRQFYAQERQRVRNKMRILSVRSDYGYFQDREITDNTPPRDELLEEQQKN